MRHVLEIVTYTLKSHVSDAEFLHAAKAIDAFAAGFEGFVSRTLGKTAAGEWIDVVRWRDMETAKAAATAFPGNADLKPVMDAIDGASVSLRHYDVVTGP